MWVPSNIREWLDERIGFCERMLKLQETTGTARGRTEMLFALSDYKYCNKLYQKIIDAKASGKQKSNFSIVAQKLLHQQLYEIQKQEFVCVTVGGTIFPTKEPAKLPQEILDNNRLLKDAFKKIYEDVKNICGDHFEPMVNGKNYMSGDLWPFFA